MSKYLLSEEEYTEYQNMKARLNELKEENEELKEENEELNKRNNFLLQRLEVDDTETSLVFKLQRELENSKSEFYCTIKSELKYKQALDEIAEHYEKVIKNLTTYDEVYDANISIEALHNISDIINKAKEDKNE